MGNIFCTSYTNHPLTKNLQVNKWSRSVASTGFAMLGMCELDEEMNRRIIELNKKYNGMFDPIDFDSISVTSTLSEQQKEKIKNAIVINVSKFTDEEFQKALRNTPELDNDYSNFFAESLFVRFVDSTKFNNSNSSLKRSEPSGYICNFDYNGGKGMCIYNISTKSKIVNEVDIYKN